MANLSKELRKALRNNAYEKSENGIVFPEQKLIVGGGFLHNVNGKDEQFDPNLVVDEGLDYILGSAMVADAQNTTFYVAAFKNDATPASNWTAASWATDVAGSGVDVDEVTRPAWVPTAVASQQTDNYSNKAQLTVAATTLDLYGAALLSDSAFGGTGGILVVATRFASTRNLQEDDAFNIGYRLTIAST